MVQINNTKAQETYNKTIGVLAEKNKVQIDIVDELIEKEVQKGKFVIQITENDLQHLNDYASNLKQYYLANGFSVTWFSGSTGKSSLNISWGLKNV